MEAKLNHRAGALPLPNHTTTFPSHSFCFKKHLRGFAKKWRIHIQEVSNSPKQLLIHVVKEGETLTSISKHYGVSVYSIAAANKNIVDIDLVFEGQHLNIPSSAGRQFQMLQNFGNMILHQNAKNRLSRVVLRQTRQLPLNAFNGILDKKNFTMQIVHGFPQAKTTGYFLVLVPLIAFCIRCIIGVFHTRVTGDLGHQDVNASKEDHPVSKSMRWKSALRDLIDADNLDSRSRLETDDTSEDGAQISSEEMSRAYGKLEHDYEKFLSQCGMSKWGYWRGGSPE